MQPIIVKIAKTYIKFANLYEKISELLESFVFQRACSTDFSIFPAPYVYNCGSEDENNAREAKWKADALRNKFSQLHRIFVQKC